MTNLPPSDPRSSPTTPLGFDEFIGIFVALTTIGAIVFWSLSHSNEGFNIAGVLSPSPSPSAPPTLTPSPQATVSPELEPTTEPTESPEVLTPVPQTPTGQRLPFLIPFQTRTPSASVPLPVVVPTPSASVPLPVVVPTPSASVPLPVVVPTPSASVPLPVVVPTPSASAPLPVVVPTPSASAPLPVVVPTPSASVPPTTTLTQPIDFVDVPSDFWAHPFINALSARNIITGFPGRYFRPTQPITRAQFATILQQTFNPNPLQKAYSFKDVPEKFWANPAIESVAKAGYLKGYPGNVFRPQQPVSRAEVLVALATVLNLATKSSPTNTLQTYQDAAKIPNYAIPKIAAATQYGLVVNYPDVKVLNPNRPTTRAEVAALMYQTLVQTGKIEPIQSQYIVPGNP